MRNLKLKSLLIGLLFVCLSFPSIAQPHFLERLEDMPMAISNNAIAGWSHYAYSFGGIDTSLSYSGITKKCFRYDLLTDTWDTIPDMPDTLGKIASAASTVGDKIYVIGGYHVYPGGGEASSHKVHIFNPLTNTWEADGVPLPIPIDDHVQLVWRDSLIYVITGWSNSGNVNAVQIYNPASDSWATGTPTPNTPDYKVFGATGAFWHEDYIVYIGGARMGLNFPLTNVLRIGHIQAEQPDSIRWVMKEDDQAIGYRLGGISFSVPYLNYITPVWIGGSRASYNYDALSYSDGTIVEPADRLINFTSFLTDTNLVQSGIGTLPFQDVAPMDIRGIAGPYYNTLAEISYIIAGGILSDGKVSKQTYAWIEIIEGIEDINSLGLLITPNPATEQIQIALPEGDFESYTIHSIMGQQVANGSVIATGNQLQIDISDLGVGAYLLSLKGDGVEAVGRFVKME